MDRHIGTKINRLLQAWPRGTVALHSWLSQQGVSRNLVEVYRKNAWLEAVGQGAFVRCGDKVEWPGAIFALQSYAGKRIHPGERTAIELHGYAHFLQLGKKPQVHLIGATGERLPRWFLDHDWDAVIRFVTSNLFVNDVPAGWSDKIFGEFSLKVSSLERAMLELLDGVSDETSFEEARLLMGGLAGLRPSVVQELLEACRSIKSKRLFLFLADEAGHAWHAKLADSRVNLGRGKRVVFRGGHLDSRYLITVPKGPKESET